MENSYLAKTLPKHKIQLTKSGWDIMREQDQRPANISLLLSQQALFLDVHVHNCTHDGDGTVHEPSVIFFNKGLTFAFFPCSKLYDLAHKI